jgi:protease-4
MSAYNYRGLLDKVGLRPEVFKSGQYKDMLSGSKKETDITPEERAMVQKLVDQTFERFKSVVAEGRKQANEQNKGGNQDPGRALSGDWKEFADGRVLSGKEAFDLGFVDELGDLETAVERARNLANIDDANLVQYQPVLDLASLFRLFGKSEPTTLKVDLGMDLPRLEAGKLYFLSPTFVH